MARKLRLREVLKSLLERHGMSARALARETGLPPATVASYLAGRGQLRPEQIALVADRFAVSLDYLLFGEEAQASALESVPTKEMFAGWLKVRIERAVPDEPRGSESTKAPPKKPRARPR